MELYGRRKIYTTEEPTEENIISLVNDAVAWHLLNLEEEEYLYWYRRGLQPILERTREIRPELVKKIVVNNADQVVTFKNGYFMTAPASYSSRSDDKTELVKRFNDYCLSAEKGETDNEIIDWFHTVGLGVLYLEPDRDGSERTPFHCCSLDPRSAFNTYSYAPGNPRVFLPD